MMELGFKDEAWEWHWQIVQEWVAKNLTVDLPDGRSVELCYVGDKAGEPRFPRGNFYDDFTDLYVWFRPWTAESNETELGDLESFPVCDGDLYAVPRLVLI